MQSQQRNQLLTAGGFALGLVGSYLAYKHFVGPWLAGQPWFLKTQSGKVPDQRALGTITDVSGNYDIDGVSFDTEGVVVSGDAHKSLSI